VFVALAMLLMILGSIAQAFLSLFGGTEPVVGLTVGACAWHQSLLEASCDRTVSCLGRGDEQSVCRRSLIINDTRLMIGALVQIYAKY
jgi:hypothetical protein